jgi:hypothetical protein
MLSDQSAPHVDSDGQQFAVLYEETPPGLGSTGDVYLSSFHVLGGNLGVSESHLAVRTTPGIIDDSDVIVSTRSTGGTSRRYALGGTTRTVANNWNVWYGLYDGLTGGPISSYCSGDSTGTACPCGNNGITGHGCGSSVNAAGAVLTASGNGSLSADSLVLTASGLPATASSLFFQGTGIIGGGAGAVFGDGLRCTNGSVIRLAVKTAAGGGVSFPTGGDPHVSIEGAVPAAGGDRYYQCWYRNSGAFCTSSTFNLTNGIHVRWLP